MPVPEIERFRQKYPQYNDLDDQTLADRLAAKYPQYADLPGKVRAEAISQTPVRQTFADLSPLQRAFYPAAAIREGLGNLVTRDLTTAQQALGATGLGQLATATAPPFVRALAAMAPQAIGQTVGTAASLPVDPSTYAFGGAGMIPNRIARMLAGATVGGVSSAAQPQATPGGVALGTALGGVGGALLRLRPREGRVTFEKPAANIPDFLRGNPKRTEAASKALTGAAHRTVISTRRGGTLHDRVAQTLSQESAKAWEPMQRVSAAIQGDIPLAEVKASVAARFADNPARAQAVITYLDTVDQAAMTAPELVDLSTSIGQFMRKAAIRGKTARTFAEQIYTDARTAIADVLEARTPQEMKGFVQQAKDQWAAYATDRDAIFKYLAPGAPGNAETTAGVRFLRRLALGEATPYEQELAGRIKATSGIDLPATIRPFAEALVKVRKRGELGRATTRNLRRVGYGVAGLTGLDYLRGQFNQ